MASVLVVQRHAHLAGAVRFDIVNGREGKLARAQFVAISNTRRAGKGSAEPREEDSTAIRWTLWGKPAEHAAQVLGKGSHVNVVGRLRNDHYEKDGQEVHAFGFTADEVDYLDSKAEADSRRARQEFVAELEAHEPAKPAATAHARAGR